MYCILLKVEREKFLISLTDEKGFDFGYFFAINPEAKSPTSRIGGQSYENMRSEWVVSLMTTRGLQGYTGE